MIEATHLSKRYGDYLAVDDLNFTVPDHAVYGLLGPNGAGKTKTMNILTGCLAATTGNVAIDGHDIFKDAMAANEISAICRSNRRCIRT